MKCSEYGKSILPCSKNSEKTIVSSATVGDREKLGGEIRKLVGHTMKGLIGHCDFGFSVRCRAILGF